MIQITVYQNKSKEFKGFRCLGHAGFAEYGEDIVCAAVSVLVINTINSIDQFTEDTFSLEQDEESGLIELRFSDLPAHDAVLLMNSMILGLKEIQQSYGKQYIAFRFKEV
jgi:hypothetical protein